MRIQQKKLNQKNTTNICFCNCWFFQHRSQHLEIMEVRMIPPINCFGGVNFIAMTSMCWKRCLRNQQIWNMCDPACIHNIFGYTEGGFKGFCWRHVCCRVQYWVLKYTTGAISGKFSCTCMMHKKTAQNTAFWGQNSVFFWKNNVTNTPYKTNRSPCLEVFEWFNVWTTHTTATSTGPRANYVKWMTILGMSTWWQSKSTPKTAIVEQSSIFYQLFVASFWHPFVSIYSQRCEFEQLIAQFATSLFLEGELLYITPTSGKLYCQIYGSTKMSAGKTVRKAVHERCSWRQDVSRGHHRRAMSKKCLHLIYLPTVLTLDWNIEYCIWKSWFSNRKGLCRKPCGDGCLSLPWWSEIEKYICGMHNVCVWHWVG